MYMYNVCTCMAVLLRVDCIALCTAVNSHFFSPLQSYFCEDFISGAGRVHGHKEVE